MHINFKSIEVCTLKDAYELRGGNKTALANELGLTRNTLRSHLDCGGHQLLSVEYALDGSFRFKYINKNWVK